MEEIKREVVEEMDEDKVSEVSWKQGKENIITQEFNYFCGCSLIFGLIYTFCLYKNPFGITYPLFVLSAYGSLWLMLLKVEIKIKKDSWTIIAAALLIGVSICRTADFNLILLSKLAELLLFIIFLIHQFYHDRRWNIGKYMASIGLMICSWIATIGFPFLQGHYCLKQIDTARYKKVIYVGIGLFSAIPIVIFAGILLMEADAVFNSIVKGWFENFFDLRNIFVAVGMIVIGALGMYCLVTGACLENISKAEKDMRTKEPVIAITCMGAVGALYLLFCTVQVIYLFMGIGTLPDGMSYSSYARQGFFQLMFVASMNLFFVLECLKYFKKNRILNGILSVVCACTYIMIFSAFYRMALYVQEYYMTYLRLLVLWFLILLTVLMAGVVCMIYRQEFPLFRYCLAVISGFYIILAWARPDYVVARYNASHIENFSSEDFSYMTEYLSADAAPVVVELFQEEAVLRDVSFLNRQKFLDDYYENVVEWAYEKSYHGLRNYNFSFETAKQRIKNSKVLSGG